MNRCYVSFAIGFMLASLSSVCHVNASGMNMDAFPDGLHQVPPNASPALGEVHGFLNTTLSNFSIQMGDGIYSNLLAGALTVTLNDGAPGTTGPVIGTFTLDTPGATSGTFQGTVPLTAQQVLDMSAGITYINITDSLFPGGEIRGELMVLPEPSTVVLAGLGGLVLLALRRRR